jgi:hypothetical protein
METPVLVPNIIAPLAYAGPAAGLEFIPYFLGLLAWAAVAIGATLGWPLAALRRRLREGRRRAAEPAAPPSEGAAPAPPR